MNYEYFPNFKKTIRLICSFAISLFIVSVATFLILFILLLKSYMVEHDILTNTWVVNSSTIAGALTTINLKFWGFIYSILCTKLTNFENH